MPVRNRMAGSTGANEYTCDVNGNLITDVNKNITSLLYNHLNLPNQIEIGTSENNTIDYVYDAAGIKLRKSVEGGVTTDYIGYFIYENDVLKYILTSNGRIVVDGNTYNYQYFIKDHLGNTRVTFDAIGTVLQEDSYYPFGMVMNGLNYTDPGLLGNETKNKYLYNGKELQDDLGLEWYDYGARFYDAQLCRWHSVDPLAELELGVSPYAYVTNNPLRFMDPTGKAKTTAEMIQEAWENTPEGGWSNTTYYHPENYQSEDNEENTQNQQQDPPDGEDPKFYTVSDYIKMWEAKHGVKMSAERKKELAKGCVGVVIAELGYKDERTDVPPTIFAYSSSEQAWRVSKIFETILKRFDTPNADGVRIYAIHFYEPSPLMCRPEADGTVDMSLWDPKMGKVGYYTFDFAVNDGKTNSWWGGNHAQPGMKVKEWSLSAFMNRPVDFNRTVFCVAVAFK